MLAAHLFDRQIAHQNTAGEPNQQLRADDQRQPFVQATGGKVQARSRFQNQILIPATMFTDDVSSPAARA
jgi:hypothetical protein